MRLITVGHGTATREEFARLLDEAGVSSVVDVRSAPGSRRAPDFNHSELRNWLPEAGVDYRWEKRLGGFRKLPENSPDVVWENSSFRAYAAHMRTEQFRTAIEELLEEAARVGTAVMCAESVWWRCHRRLIADHVMLARGVEAAHLMSDGSLREHSPMGAARLRADGLLVYDGDWRMP
ncbi:DUF488 family protein [Actinopolyspora halophila]|uniref:DUF488 family protein n=1 Tax=Actinopolyspora halophila TaxID=1850 RepID=UPI000526C6C7